MPRPQLQPASDDDDAKLRPLEPDFVTINLPTTLPLPKHADELSSDATGSTRICRATASSTQLGNLFGLDNGANIGLEFRYGVMKHLEAIVLRTSIGKTFQFTAKYDGWHQTATMPVGLSAIVSIEGDNNFHNTEGGAQANFAPALGAVVSRTIGGSRWRSTRRRCGCTTPAPAARTTARHRLHRPRRPRAHLARARISSLEGSPRIGGLAIGDAQYAFAIEKRVGAHVFSLTFSNGAGTTFRQIAHGGIPEHLNLGFNLTRKFY